MSTIARLERDVPYPKIHPSFTPIEVTPDEVQFRVGPWSGPVYTIQDDDGDGDVRRLVRTLDGSTSVRDVVAEFDGETREQVVSILAALAEKGVVTTGASGGDGPVADDAARYGAVRASLSDDDVDAARRKGVAVVGGGAMADLVTENLAEMGVDPVTVAPDERAVLGEAVEAADLLICAVDRPRPDLLSDLNRRAHDAETAWLVGQIHGLDGFVGPTVFPGETACYECFRERMLANVAFGNDAYPSDYAEKATAMGLLPLAQILAGYLTLDAFHLLVDDVGFTAGSVLHFDFFDFSVESNEVLKLPRCDACGRDPSSPQRFVTVEQLVAEREDR